MKENKKTNQKSWFQICKRKYESARIKTKIMLSVFLSVTLVLAGSTGFFFARYTKTIEENAQRQYFEFFSQAVIQLDNIFASVEENGKYILNTSELLQVFRHLQMENYSLSNQIDDYFSMSRISGQYNLDASVKSLRFYMNTDALYIRDRNEFFPLSELESQEWYQRMLIAGNSPFWVYWKDQDQISCFQAVYKNVQTGEVLGVLEQEINQEEIKRILTNISEFSLGNSLLIDNTGAICCDIGEEDTEDLLKFTQEVSAEQEPSARQIGNAFWATQQLNNQFYLSGSLSNTYIERKMSAPILEMLLFFFFSMAISAVLAKVISRNLSERIQNISTRVSQIDVGSDEQLPVEYDDEITGIELTLNKFLKTIREYIQEISRVEQQKKEADFRVLQEQINPHFVYNSLDSINWLAQERGEEQIARMAQLLGKFFRISLSRGSQLIPFSQELEHVKTYLAIMQIRFDGSISAFYEIDPAVLSLPILKILLQPLVENAILHGISGLETRQGSIWITAKRKDGLNISVRDDGVGIPPEILEEINRILLSPEPPDKCFGLWNINQRMMLYYGKRTMLKITSGTDTGTEVSFTVPDNHSTPSVDMQHLKGNRQLSDP